MIWQSARKVQVHKIGLSTSLSFIDLANMTAVAILLIVQCLKLLIEKMSSPSVNTHFHDYRRREPIELYGFK